MHRGSLDGAGTWLHPGAFQGKIAKRTETSVTLPVQAVGDTEALPRTQQRAIVKLGAIKQLETAQLALNQGNVVEANRLAFAVLEVAVGGGDKHLEAKALSCLALSDRLLSKFRTAHKAAASAALLFQVVGDLTGEAAALSTLAHTASVLGRNEEAVEAALLGVELGRRVGALAPLAVTHVHLGVALFYAKAFEQSHLAFGEAIRLGTACEPPLGAFQVLATQACCEATRVITHRHETGVLPDLTRLESLLATCAQLADIGQVAAIAPGVQVSLMSMWWFVSALAACWFDDVDKALSALGEGQKWSSRYGTTKTWLNAFEAFVQCEIAQAQEQWSRAQVHAMCVVTLGSEVEHEQMVALGHLVSCRVFSMQGRHDLALQELRDLAVRERRIRTESLESRARVVQWQLDMRSSEQSRTELAASAERLERLSLEDPLTGIANRRCFELRANDLLRESKQDRRPLSVALIDVDNFKQVNDTHSHLVGDNVLKTIAALMKQQIREDDLAVRLAGDEFILLLRRVDLAHASEVCERFKAAVKSFDWNAIAPGLAVTVSVGLAQSEGDESLESLVHRSDAAMYRSKRGL